jgi:nucleoside-diphosphate-sugar epimerase
LVASHLAAGDHVRVLARDATQPFWGREVEIISGDLVSADPQRLRSFAKGADVLYHCAAEQADSLRMTAVNVEGTRGLLAAAGGAGRWVQLSSLGVYGGMRSGVVREDTAPCPAGAYEVSKLAADRIVVDTCGRVGIQWVVLRPGIVFGHDMPNDSMRALLRAIRRGRFVFIGPRGALLPYVHVDDVVAALVLCGGDKRAAGEIFNLSDHCTVEEFVVEAARLLTTAPPAARVPRVLAKTVAMILSSLPGFPLTSDRVDALTRRVRYPIDKLAHTLEFRLATGWRNGLREMIAAL